MKRLAQGVAALLMAGVVLLAGFLAGLAYRPVQTPPLHGPAAVSEIRPVRLGGVKQWLLIRGLDRSRPVLLFLHGGPGYPLVPLAHAFGAELEKHFVVVHWDQRGAGKSCHDGIPLESLHIEQYVADTIQLIEQRLPQWLGPQKVVLAGHSWGSVLGVLVAQRRPELLRAYVGLGQLVSKRAQSEIGHHAVLERARAAGNARAVAQLEAHPPPYGDTGSEGRLKFWLGYYEGDSRRSRTTAARIFDFARGWTGLLATLARTPEYSLTEKLRTPGCLADSAERTRDELAGIDFRETAIRFTVPVHFFAGRHDLDTPGELVADYVSQLQAPRKELVWFEDSGHFVMLDEAERFQRALIERFARP